MESQANNQAFYFQLFFFSFPILLGTIVALAKPIAVVNWTNRFGQWAINKRTSHSERSSSFSKFVLHPFFWCLAKIEQWTGHIKSEFVRSGVRVGAYMYFVAVVAYLVIMVTIIIVAAIIALLMFSLIAWLLTEGSRNRGGYSVKRKRFLGGDYIEHYDDSGQKIGTSEVKTGFFGDKYVQHYDEAGRKAGYSEEKEGFLGGGIHSTL